MLDTADYLSSSVVETQAIRNPILKRTLDREKQLFYDRAAA